MEVFYQNTWGTVCDRGWNDFSAQAVCNMLGWRYETERFSVLKIQIKR